MMPDFEKICAQVCDLTKVTSLFLQEQAALVKQEHVEVKGHNNFVTYVDKSVEEKLVAGLQKIIPDAGFIAEENSSLVKSETFNWVIDPLDGTTNFIHGLPCYCISIAFLMKNEPVVGVIYEPNLKECFYAFKGGGAFLNGQKITTSPVKKVSDALVATGFPYTNYSRMSEYMNLFEYLLRHSRGLRRLGSAAVDLAYVACGRFDVFYEYGLQPWDVAAGVLIVKEAGGRVSDFKGGDNCIFGEEIIASSENIYNEFKEVLSSHFQ